MAAPSTPTGGTRGDPLLRVFTECGCPELHPLMKACYPVLGVFFSDLELFDADLEPDKAQARLKMNSPAITSTLAKLTAKEVSDGVAEGDRKVLVTVAPAAATDATKAQHSRFARAVKTLYKLDCDGAFAPRSTGRSNASGFTPSAPPSGTHGAGTPGGTPAAPGSAVSTANALKQAGLLSTCETQMGLSLPVNVMPQVALIQLVADSWVAAKPRAITLAEAAKYLGPRESAGDYVAGEKPESRATQVSAEFLRLLLAYAIGTAQALPASVGGCAVTLATSPHLDGGTGLADASVVLGLKVCMAMLVHLRFTLATRGANHAQSYELRKRLVASMVRLQTPASSAPVTITQAFAGALDADDLKLASLEDARASLPIVEKEKDKAKEGGKKDKDDKDEKSDKDGKRGGKGSGKNKGKSSKGRYNQYGKGDWYDRGSYGDDRRSGEHWPSGSRRSGSASRASRSRSPERRSGGDSRWASRRVEFASSARGDRDRGKGADRRSHSGRWT